MLEDIGFERFFDGVRELHTCVREEFYAVVVVRIVRCGNNDASLKIILANETSNARSGDDACKSYRPACLGDSSGEKSGYVRTGLARVHADEDMSGGVLAAQIRSERAARGIKSGVIERRSAGNAANTVSSEECFWHERLAIFS